MRARIVIAEEHAIVRIGLRSVLSAEKNFRVAAEAADGVTALRLVERHRPHILLIGMVMPGTNAFDVIRQAKSLFPATLSVVFSRYAQGKEWFKEALIAGARGYILKTASPKEIVKGLREVLFNRTYLSPELFEFNLGPILERAPTGPIDLYQTLSPREREILQLCAESLSSKEIGSRLGICYRTVEKHRANLMDKLGCHRLAEVVRFAVERQLLMSPSPVLNSGRHPLIARTQSVEFERPHV